MPNPYVVVNEWSGVTGHANLSLYDQNGNRVGIYGANTGDMDFNPFNGFEGGVYDETNRQGSPIKTTTFSLAQNQFDNLRTHVQQQVTQTAAQTGGYYFLFGHNCVDQIDQWLDYANVPHDMTSLFSGSLLDGYATARYWLTEGWNWVYQQIDGITGFDYNLLNDIDRWLQNFWDGVKSLFSSDSDNEVSGAEQSLVDTIYSPIAIDLDGNGLTTTNYLFKHVLFDLDGNATLDQTAWLSPEDAFLAIDLNGDGQINSGGELFGGAIRGEGYAKLAAYDTNQDGVLSSADDAFDQLLVWRDANSDGVTDDGELLSLSEVNINEISVQYSSWEQYDNGNLIGEHSWATVIGSRVAVGDVYFIANLEIA